EGTSPGPAPDVVAREERLHLVPKRTRLAWAAVVARRVAHEVDALRRARAGGVEEIAVASDLIRPCQPGAGTLVEIAPRVVGEERGFVPASRQATFLEAEQKHDLEATRARAQEIEQRDAPRVGGGRAAYLGTLEGGDDL